MYSGLQRGVLLQERQSLGRCCDEGGCRCSDVERQARRVGLRREEELLRLKGYITASLGGSWKIREARSGVAVFKQVCVLSKAMLGTYR